MQITRPKGPRATISLVAMIDVLMILLVFFMVTSTYLDLDMVPLAGADGAAAEANPPETGPDPLPARLLVRLGSDGAGYVRGRALEATALSAMVAGRLAETPALEVLVLPSGQADVQALATLMDALVAGGATRLRLIRLEGQP